MVYSINSARLELLTKGSSQETFDFGSHDQVGFILLLGGEVF
jgi:hypothetical protein